MRQSLSIVITSCTLMGMKFTLQNFIATLEWLDEDAGSPEAYTRADMTALVIDALESMQVPACFSCGQDTFDLHEYYMVQPELWRTYGVEGMLCIGCLETRLGRKLAPADFVDAPINSDDSPRSARLKDRLGW